MNGQILHSGFDGLRFTIQTEITVKLRNKLDEAKIHAEQSGSDCDLYFGNRVLSVTKKGGRNYNCHTGQHGAVWIFQDPENRIPNNPGVTVDFRALGLATGGLDHAELHFRDMMVAFEIPYTENQLRVSRVDFAVDILAPSFELDRRALITPPGTQITEYAGIVTEATNGRATGLRAGAINSRQIAIYDKRGEIMQKAKLGWLEIWHAERKKCGQPLLDLNNRLESQIWRFELRLGQKQLRGKFAMHTWLDLRDTIGDACNDALGRMRYCVVGNDSNRARWPVHELWQQFVDTIGSDLSAHCCGVQPDQVIHANRSAKMRELDRQLLGLFVSRAAISDVPVDEFYAFMERHVDALQHYSEEHPKALNERLQKASGRYQLT
ncbi:hypothetical protein [Yoonia sp. I 8.24]|uniref:hypothetical protein n=1 Tax=Yoonia sp. I 8.24 TaxID=1537229 RepID=UPI001EDE29AA|nr:hypothetical protein [Yoonia sp. I 8.24]MCG3266597.1 hypothetical protein [Yoonia sp. I 8.24]